jgi:hypothetical protein
MNSFVPELIFFRDLLRSVCGLLLVDAVLGLQLFPFGAGTSFELYSLICLSVILINAVFRACLGISANHVRDCVVFFTPFVLINLGLLDWPLSLFTYVVVGVLIALGQVHFPGLVKRWSRAELSR